MRREFFALANGSGMHIYKEQMEFVTFNRV